MKLINQSFEILEQKDFTLKGIKKFIERCARVSYKSEDNITDTSYEKFVNMLENRGHNRPLEFGTVYLALPIETMIPMQINGWYKYSINPYSKGCRVCEINGEKKVAVTTNYRVIIENGWEDDLKYLCEPTEYHDKRYTVHFITSRGIVDEFRTHVGLSHLAESTRYVNYSKDKFGKELNIILPANWDNYTYKQQHEFDFAWTQAEECYMKLIDTGCAPQQAREVLPLSVKSELISCGFKDAWDNFFYRRCANDAHPMAKEIANKIHDEFIKKNYISQ